MTHTAEIFKEKKYVYLKNFLSRDNCKILTKFLQDKVKEGVTKKDHQCPLSQAIHGDATLDRVLEDLTPYFEKVSGLKLFPTYSYARVYEPGEVLKKHTDREACEISATLTVGYEGGLWPFYVEGSKFNIELGDAVLYRGIEVEHWRDKYTEGKWQAQIFLHYVDAEGEFKDQKYDGRAKLGIPKIAPKEKTKIPDCAFFENHLHNKYCREIIKEYSKETHIKLDPIIGDNTIDKTVRDVKRYLIPDNQGIGGILTATALNANNYWWKYTVTHSNQTEFLMYEPDGHYNAHVDTYQEHSDETRKLTALAFLNDDFEGGKFFLNADGNIYYPPQKKGTVIVFPSYFIHGVEPVTKGIRYSVVSWLVGPYFK